MRADSVRHSILFATGEPLDGFDMFISNMEFKKGISKRTNNCALGPLDGEYLIFFGHSNTFRYISVLDALEFDWHFLVQKKWEGIY